MVVKPKSKPRWKTSKLTNNCSFRLNFVIDILIFRFPTQGPLPLRDDNGIVLLGERAAKCRAYAKALHYKELEFQKGPSPQILESLIR